MTAKKPGRGAQAELIGRSMVASIPIRDDHDLVVLANALGSSNARDPMWPYANAWRLIVN
jgi:hypothetical protein